MRPYHTEILAQGASTMARLLTERALLALQRRPWRCNLCHPFQVLMPAVCECARHQTMGGIDEIIWPPRPLGLVVGCLQIEGHPYRGTLPMVPLGACPRKHPSDSSLSCCPG